MLCSFNSHTCIQNTPAATDMSVENFVTFSADLTEQDYFNLSVSGTIRLQSNNLLLSLNCMGARVVVRR